MASNYTILVMGVYWTPTAPTAVSTQTSIVNHWNRVSGALMEASYGIASITATATPMMKIVQPIPASTASTSGEFNNDYGDAFEKAKAAAVALGYAPDTYDRLAIYTVQGEEGTGARQPGIWCWYGDRYSQNPIDEGQVPVSLHELVHTMGLNHAHSLFCTNGASTPQQSYGFLEARQRGTPAYITGSQVVLPTTLTATNSGIDEYGDTYTVMGQAFYVHPSPLDKFWLGWLQGRLVTLTKGQSAVLLPRVSQAAGNSAAVVHVSATRSYWFEYVTTTETYGTAPIANEVGVYVRMHDWQDRFSDGSELLDMVPAAAGVDAGFTPFVSPQLVAGKSWTSPEGFTFAVSNVSSSGATLTVS